MLNKAKTELRRDFKTWLETPRMHFSSKMLSVGRKQLSPESCLSHYNILSERQDKKGI